MKEFEFISRVRAVAGRDGGVALGIGDDCAVIDAGGRPLLATTDTMVDGIHFVRSRTSPDDLAGKLFASTISDIAAMGGEPRAVLLACGFPAGLDDAWLDLFATALGRAAAANRVALAGGDTVRAPAVVLTLTALGVQPGSRSLTRSGARPDDLIFVNYRPGLSAGGLFLLANAGPIEEAFAGPLFDAHLRPRAMVEEGLFLASEPAVTAGIDSSDGLDSDLGHILDESGGFGADLDRAALPIHPSLQQLEERLPDAPPALDLALSGGEDYGLIFTLRPQAAGRFERAYRERFGDLFLIGRVTEEPGIRLVDGDRATPHRPAGWDHFA